ncbi:MAG: o-succinylbenzoate synthase [Actinomycetota bacterium]
MTTELGWHPFRVPLKAPFRGVSERSGALVSGPRGWGEFSPFPGYSDREVDRCLASAVACARDPLPRAVRRRVAVHATVGAVPAQQAARLVQASGCAAAKVKVGEGDDYSRVEAVRQALGPQGLIMVDANGAWTLEEAERAIRRLGPLEVGLVEQPVATLQDMVKLRRSVQVPLAADELVTSPEAARRIAAAEAADVLVVKVQSLGGVDRSMRTVQACGLPAIVSNLIETSVGIWAGLALAAALDDLPYTCGLGTAGMLAGDLVAASLIPVDGWLAVERPEVDPARLREFAAQEPPVPSRWPR